MNTEPNESPLPDWAKDWSWSKPKTQTWGDVTWTLRESTHDRDISVVLVFYPGSKKWGASARSLSRSGWSTVSAEEALRCMKFCPVLTEVLIRLLPEGVRAYAQSHVQ